MTGGMPSFFGSLSRVEHALPGDLEEAVAKNCGKCYTFHLDIINIVVTIGGEIR